MLRGAAESLPEAARREAGLPDAETARAQAEILFREVWKPALAALG